MAYTSLFKKDDVRVTQAFSSTHKGLDLSRGVVEQPIYLPNKAQSGYVWKILPGYTSGGVYYPDSPIIYVKHPDGSGSRYIHSYPKNVKVKVGDNVVAGQQICCTGNSGHSFGDHLHFEWLTKWDDLNTRVDPAPYVVNDKPSSFKVGDTVIVTDVQNIRKGSGTSFEITGETKIGDVYTIEYGPRVADGYTWWDFKNADWVADVGKFKIYTPPTPPTPVDPTIELNKQIETLKTENRGLAEALAASQGTLKTVEERVTFIEETLKLRDTELKEIEIQLDRITEERNRFEAEKNELLMQGTLTSATTGAVFAELWKRITRSIR
jgi:murein DD-endopeptidase MepM/ murein hydrolase activator NlpD